MITRIPLRFVTIEKIGCHILVDAIVNGIPMKLIVDTGASLSVFNLHAFDEIMRSDAVKNEQDSYGISAESLESYLCTVESFILGTLEIQNYTAALMDLKAINETYEKLGNGKIDGLLGGDILKKYKAAIDYKTKMLKLRH